MNLSQPALRHATVRLQGWDLANQVWVSDITLGDWKRQDSFIVNRSFGLVKRLFLAAAQFRILDTYGLIKAPDEEIFIIESENANLRHDQPYSYSYQFRKAPYTARLYKMVPGPPLQSGLPGNPVAQDLYTTPCDIERFGTLGSTEFFDVRYTQMSVILPGNITVDTDTLIEIDGRDYDIREFYPNVRENVALCVLKGIAS